jgi:arylformamidase
MDIFPAAEPGAPVVVFIHGGYWRRLSSKEFGLVALGLVAHGFTVVVTNYSLCPKVSISEITRQSRAALAWLWQHAGDYNGDRGKIIVCGHSAGGQQVGMLAATDWPGEYDLPPSIVRAGIPISGVFDLRPLRYSWLQPKILLTHEIIERESPCFHVPANSWPMLVMVGGEESTEFQRQSAEFHAALIAHDTPSRLYTAPTHNHFTIIEALAEPDSAVCREVAQFVRLHCV